MKATSLVFLFILAFVALGQTGTLEKAIRDGDAAKVQAVLAAGANPNLPLSNGRTPLIDAASRGRVEIVRLLISAGAGINISDRGTGTALEAAEREGHEEIAAMLRKAGARTSGRSVGDKVCVRPWKGDGYCGIVEAIHGNDYSIHVTGIVGCVGGCAAMEQCSAGKQVGGDGLRTGDTITVPNACLTHTGVAK